MKRLHRRGRAGQALAAMVVAGLVGGLAVWFWPMPWRSGPGEAGTSGKGRLAGVPASPASASSAAAVATSDAMAQALPDAPLAALAAAAASGHEVCGVGHFAAPDKNGLLDHAGQRALEETVRLAREATLQAMLLSRSDDVRAAAYLLQTSGFGVLEEERTCQGEDCVESERLAAERGRRLRQQAAVAGPALVALAQRTRSGRAYAIARQACRSAEQGPSLQGLQNAALGVGETAGEGAGHGWTAACIGLSARRWAEMEPDNAAPWLALASEAHAAGDVAGLKTALHRAALARRHDARFGGVTALVLSHVPEQVQGWPRLAVALGAMDLDVTAVEAESYLAASRYCEAAAQDANRRQVCTGIGEVLMSHGGNLLDLTMGARLAGKAGVDDARAALAREEFRRLTALSTTSGMAIVVDAGQSGCAGVERTLAYLGKLGREGELSTLRAMDAARRRQAAP